MHKSPLTLLLFLLAFTSLQAQDTILLNRFGGSSNRNLATMYRVISPDSGMYRVEDYLLDGTLQMRGHSTLKDSMVRTGYFTLYDEKGRLTEEGNYLRNRKTGEWKNYRAPGYLKEVEHYNNEETLDGPFLVYRPDGSLKRKDVYKKGELTEKRCIGLDGKDTTWFEYRTMPVFPGGETAMIRFLQENIKYPQVAREIGAQGYVFVNFTVLKTGKLDHVNILRGVEKSLDDESLRVIRSMPDWTPGKIDGELVNVEFNLPVKFTLVSSGPGLFNRKQQH